MGPERLAPLAAAIERAGGVLVDAPDDANAIVWASPYERREELPGLLHAAVEWVQLDAAGVDDWIERGLLDRERTWTGAQGVYAGDVAEHALAFVLAAARRLPQAARRRRWEPLAGERLAGKTVGVVGAGAIGREAIARLAAFRVRTLALTRSGREVAGADRSLAAGGLGELLAESDFVVLAAPLTDETRGMIGERELALIGPSGWLVNVARGPLVDTRALVTALRGARIAGACLDVTDPEPLPESHPLWGFDNVLVTPHVANPPHLEHEALAQRVAENVRRFREGRDLVGVVDLERAY